jgi:hypothetical protein
MVKTYHILNGDALNERFPEGIQGERIIMRECLIEGPLKAKNPDTFFEERADYLKKTYAAEADSLNYEDLVMPEIEKMRAIDLGSEVNLWFEDDLFCQANLWFVIHLLRHKADSFFLVRPDQRSPYSFAAYNQQELTDLMEKKLPVHSIDMWSKLWQAYADHDLELLEKTAEEMSGDYPFVRNAVKAHTDRYPADGPGRPERSLQQIKAALNTDEFGPVFRVFSQREAIYGFGDLQVKRMFDSNDE